jgi:NADH-quinone oxidoreductase subunit N
MLYGISLLAGRFGTAYLPDLAAAYVAAVKTGGFDSVLVLGTLFVIIGIAFKLAAVPFHFWCPDVFEGAAAEVAGFLSVASKGAALALLARFAMAFGGAGGLGVTAGSISPEAARHLVPVLAFLAILTATFGNLAAYKQTNLKRLLAYSTIAHAGYMMMAVATLTAFGIESMLVYLTAYLLMNLGAFAVVAFLRNQTGSEDLADFRGLVRRSPWMVITLSIFLLSLLGVPPLAGFIAKFQVFAAVLAAAEEYRSKVPSLTPWLYVMLAFGLVNSVASAVYYVKVMKVMIIDARVEDVEGKEPVPLREPAGSVAYSALVAGLVCLFLVFWTPLKGASQRGASAPERVAERSGGER